MPHEWDPISTQPMWAGQLDAMTARLLAAMDEKRYQEALRLLHRIREAVPHDRSVSRSIQILKKRLLKDYTKTIGNLDFIPCRRSPPPEELEPTERLIWDLVDGMRSYREIIAAASEFETYHALATLLERRDIEPRTTSGGFDLTRPPEKREGGNLFDLDEIITQDIPEEDRDSVVYLELVGRATEALLDRRFEEALTLFEECERFHPDDRLVKYNLERLKRRVRGGT